MENMVIIFNPETCSAQWVIDANLPYKKLFLGGTIDNGFSHNWQKDVISKLEKESVIIFNPRRTGHFDASDEIEFAEQVDWELTCLENSEYVMMYFAPGSKSPISLLELGMISQRNPANLFVCCPEGYWKKFNVDKVCERYGIEQFSTLDEITNHLISLLRVI